MGATGLAANPKEYRERLDEQTDEQIDAWASELMRDIAIRRGVLQVIKDFLRAASIDERGFERVFAAGGGPPAVDRSRPRGPAARPGDHPPCARAGHPVRDEGRPGAGSSSTSSRTSRISSTSDPPPAADRPAPAGPSTGDLLLGIGRLVHPFPSVLAALVTVAIGVVAGGEATVVIRLGLAMLAIQFGIGAINDVADAASDRDAGRSKPIAAGVLSTARATLIGVVCLVVGLALAGTVGAGVLGLAALGAGAGIVYDLRLKGTAVSWLGFTLGIPVLPAVRLARRERDAPRGHPRRGGRGAPGRGRPGPGQRAARHGARRGRRAVLGEPIARPAPGMGGRGTAPGRRGGERRPRLRGARRPVRPVAGARRVGRAPGAGRRPERGCVGRPPAARVGGPGGRDRLARRRVAGRRSAAG